MGMKGEVPMDPIAALITGAALLGCMMLSYVQGWKDAVSHYYEAMDGTREDSRKR